MDENPNYITVLQAVHKSGTMHCAAVRTWDKTTEDYITTKCSQPLPFSRAMDMASAWAVKMGLEQR